MKVILQNSAMMPGEGHYLLRRLTKDQFVEQVQIAFASGRLVSRISYSQNVELIRRWTKVKVELNRDRTEIQDGDVLLCMTLKYREGRKGRDVGEDDFEFWICNYQS